MKLLIGILLAAVALVAVVKFGDTNIGGDVKFGHALESMLYGTIAVSLAASLLLRYRGKLSTALLSAVAWVAIFAVAIVGYTYRKDLEVVASRVMDEVVPGRKVKSAPGQAIIVRARNGHFFLEGMTNGTTLRYMFDTGASAVVLTAADAKRAGFPTGSLSYSAIVSTANGRAAAAPVRISALTIGGITQRNVRALVAKPGALRENLLGMSFLGNLTSYTVRKNRLLLQQ